MDDTGHRVEKCKHLSDRTSVWMRENGYQVGCVDDSGHRVGCKHLSDRTRVWMKENGYQVGCVDDSEKIGVWWAPPQPVQ